MNWPHTDTFRCSDCHEQLIKRLKAKNDYDNGDSDCAQHPNERRGAKNAPNNNSNGKKKRKNPKNPKY